MELSVDAILKIVNSPGGIVVLVVLVMIAGAKGVWVWGRTYEREVKRADRLEELVTRNVRIAEKAMGKR